MLRLNKFSIAPNSTGAFLRVIRNFLMGMGNYIFVFNVACMADFEIARNMYCSLRSRDGKNV